LIEVLVAAVATAILMVALYGVFSRGVSLRDDATARLQEVRLKDRALQLLRDDIRHGLVTGARMAASLEGSVDSPVSRFPGYLRFTTTTGPTTREAFYGDLQEVEYYIAEDPWSTNQRSGALVRTLNRTLLAQVREEPREEVLLRGVEALEIRFFDGNNWLDSWEFVDNESSLPLAVEVVVRAVGARTVGRLMPPALQLVEPWRVQRVAESEDEEGEATETGEDGQSGGPSGGGGGPGGGGGGSPSPPQGGGRG
jgi:uncharacterized membrane protein YgcG